MMEAELFGHERGAFTGAVATRKGVFELAHGGTFFIDEIGDIEPQLQSRLLRAIERQEVRPVGSNTWMKVDVRVIAATRRDLDKDVQAGAFRDDLFFRLAVGRIELPPLRQRAGDIAILATHFWSRLGGGDRVPYKVLRSFEDHTWPGNVRELYNAVARRIALGESADVAAFRASVPPPPARDQDDPAPEATPGGHDDLVEGILALDLPLPRARHKLVDIFEHRYIARVLARHGGNVARAAEASGIARRYFNVLKARQGK
jgi:transcriptional regulator with GAF, ATPase, and Fis domain